CGPVLRHNRDTAIVSEGRCMPPARSARRGRPCCARRLAPMSTATRFAARRLGDLLVEHAGVSTEQVEHALGARTDARERLGQALVRLGYLSEAGLVQTLARQFALPVADVGKLTAANREAVQLVPEHLARESQLLALALHGTT